MSDSARKTFPLHIFNTDIDTRANETPSLPWNIETPHRPNAALPLPPLVERVCTYSLTSPLQT